MSRFRSPIPVVAVAVLAVGGATAAAVTAQKSPSDVEVVTATLRNAAGAEVANVEFRKSPRSAMAVIVSGRGLTPGYHGFHVHAVGRCDAPDFMTAMGHMKNPGEDHGAHKGDFPPLLVKRDGTTTARFQTDRFGFDALRDADGSAVMIHESSDNLGNIPTARYDPDPDQTTRDTGDAGKRFACGTITAG
ncbi:MAG: superoxide dismutase family protein [Actinomycetota bacterium]|nr:superoxide dismutase family protein [Actinomycetota bacterium]